METKELTEVVMALANEVRLLKIKVLELENKIIEDRLKQLKNFENENADNKRLRTNVV